MRNITFTQKDEFQAISIEHQGSYMLITPKFERFFSWATKHDQLKNMKKGYARYYDDPRIVAEENLRADALLELKGMGNIPPLDSDMKIITIPKQKYITIEHKGPYKHLPDTYNWFFGVWVMNPKNQVKFAEQPTLEEYVNSPHNTKPEDLITLIHVAIK